MGWVLACPDRGAAAGPGPPAARPGRAALPGIRAAERDNLDQPARLGGTGPVLAAERLHAEPFHASYQGDPRGLLTRAWDLDGLARAYRSWLASADGLIAAAGPAASDETVFALRSLLVHEWRKFLFTDPGLPTALLPPGWPGHDAARLFQAESARLWPAASRYVDRCLRADQPAAAPPLAGSNGRD
jgi:hypothetical protein